MHVANRTHRRCRIHWPNMIQLCYCTKHEHDGLKPLFYVLYRGGLERP